MTTLVKTNPFPKELNNIVPLELRDKSLVFLTGSYSFGTNTPESDLDYTVIYYDRIDHKRLNKVYPRALHSKSVKQDQKGYSLEQFARITLAGNFDACLLASCLSPVFPRSQIGDVEYISKFLSAVRPHLVTQDLASSLMGYMTGVNRDLISGSPTPKNCLTGLE